ncbi:hypothetical protein SH1V18_47660 [Vallitalea longa]|uniref:Chitinase II/V-like catalytic domain-containing protein n=1 Tax=Vallitalea longa TaxID=2936439 RepID=A0A9W5YGL1_9FIRM|nr:glycosyl hydrolase family 18 protein [Vallitalea longa]GKX32286.1 hypothetical protein SH1V18_47660 [Vallitalea longa]
MIFKRGYKLLVCILLVSSLIPTSISNAKTTFAQTSDDYIETYTVTNEKTSKDIDGINYNSDIYMPISKMADILGKDILVEDKNIKITPRDNDEKLQLKEDFVLHGFYALSSLNQFNDMYNSGTLSNFDSLSFGWSRIDQVGDGVELVFDGADYKIPDSYEKPLNKMGNMPRQLMIYVNDNGNRNDYFKAIFNDMDSIIDDIVSIVNGTNISYKDLSFDGVTIDFENVNGEDQDDFVKFLKSLKDRLGKKTVYVALPSYKYHVSYKFKEILDVVDYAILMEHDYDMKVKSSTFNNIITDPLTPIDEIEKDIKDLIQIVGDNNKRKLLLQINFGSAQWIDQGENYAKFTPSYDKIYNRICKELAKNVKIEDLLYYSDNYQNPYLIYTNTNNQKNFMWYENWISVLAKIKLANNYNMGGISLWRLGTMPNYYSKIGKEAGFDVWYQLSNLFNN